MTFEVVVELLGDAVPELGDERLDIEPGHEHAEQSRRPAELGEIADQGLTGTRILDLDRDFAAIFPLGVMHLADGCRRGGLVVETGEPLAPVGTELLTRTWCTVRAGSGGAASWSLVRVARYGPAISGGSAASKIDNAWPNFIAPPLSSPRTLKICSAVRCWISVATISAGRPPMRLPNPRAVRPAKPIGSVASLAVRVTARRGKSLTSHCPLGTCARNHTGLRFPRPATPRQSGSTSSNVPFVTAVGPAAVDEPEHLSTGLGGDGGGEDGVARGVLAGPPAELSRDQRPRRVTVTRARSRQCRQAERPGITSGPTTPIASPAAAQMRDASASNLRPAPDRSPVSTARSGRRHRPRSRPQARCADRARHAAFSAHRIGLGRPAGRRSAADPCRVPARTWPTPEAASRHATPDPTFRPPCMRTWSPSGDITGAAVAVSRRERRRSQFRCEPGAGPRRS